MHYHKPSEMREALALLSNAPMQILAGGTDIYPATDRPQLTGDILDVTSLPDLKGIRETATHFRIGATTTWSEIIVANLPPAFDALKQSAREVGAVQIQNSGTIGGNLCNASPAADGVPPLLILGAEVELASADRTRSVPLQDFIRGNRETALVGGELMSAVLIPKSEAKGRSIFLKLGARHSLVISIVMCAARLEIQDQEIRKAAISVGACSPVACRLPEVEHALVGASLTGLPIFSEAMLAHQIAPISDVRADAPYRSRAALELIERAIGALIDGV